MSTLLQINSFRFLQQTAVEQLTEQLLMFRKVLPDVGSTKIALCTGHWNASVTDKKGLAVYLTQLSSCIASETLHFNFAKRQYQEGG